VKAKKNTMEDDIAFMRLQSAEDDRRRRLDQEREADIMDEVREPETTDDPLFEPTGSGEQMASATAPHLTHADDDLVMDDGGDPIEDSG